MSEDPHKPLRDDVRLLGGLLGETLRRQEGVPLFERVERVRSLSKRSRHSASGEDHFETLASELQAMPTESAVPIARSFAHFLNLANIAEQHHRMRRRRAYQRDPHGRPQQGSIEETFPRLIGGGVPPEALHAAVQELRIELVITAHPTEIMRRTLQHKYSRLAAALADLDRPDLTSFEREALVETIRREITAAWETEEVRRERPTPLDEVRSALAVFEETLWDAVPQYCRSLERTLRETTGHELPLEVAPIRFGSWIGGDRDGNPSVTPEVTRRACLMSRWTALSLYAKEIEALRFELSMSDATPELRARAANTYEPYRTVLRGLQQRLEFTLRHVEDPPLADEHVGDDRIVDMALVLGLARIVHSEQEIVGIQERRLWPERHRVELPEVAAGDEGAILSLVERRVDADALEILEDQLGVVAEESRAVRGEAQARGEAVRIAGRGEQPPSFGGIVPEVLRGVAHLTVRQRPIDQARGLGGIDVAGALERAVDDSLPVDRQ